MLYRNKWQRLRGILEASIIPRRKNSKSTSWNIQTDTIIQVLEVMNKLEEE